MRYVEVSGTRLSVIGVGTWQFGSREWGYGEQYASSEAVRIVRRALELGINLVDTAEVYAFGRSERIVGEALAGGFREKAFVATKLLPVLPLPGIVVARGKASRSRLGIDSIDLYQLHWPNPVVPLRATMDGMARLRDEGVIRHIGVSNYSLSQWKAAERALGAPVLSNQVQYSLICRAPEKELTGYARSNGRLIIAYSPLGQGFLSGRYDKDHRPKGLRARTPAFQPQNLERGRELIDSLARIGKSHGATPSQVALAWVVSHPNVVAIPGASSVAQLEANAEAGDLELETKEIEELDQLSSQLNFSVGWFQSIWASAIGVAESFVRR